MINEINCSNVQKCTQDENKISQKLITHHLYLKRNFSASYSTQITSGIYGHQGITYPPDHVR